MNILTKLKQRFTGEARRLFSNTGWIMLDRIFHMIISLVISSLTARYLGTSNYGLLNYGLSFITIFTIVCKLGIDSIIVNEIVKNQHDTGKLMGTTIGLRLISGALSVVVISVVVMIFKPSEWIVLMITTIQSISLLFVAFDTIDYWFQSRLQSKFSALAKSISYILVSIWKVILLISRADVIYFAIATVIDAVAIGLLLLIFYRKANGPKLSFSKTTAKHLLITSSPFILSSLLITVYTQMDRIMLGSYGDGSTMVGIYTAAMTISNMWVFIPHAIVDSARPLIMKHKTQGEEQSYVKRYTQLYTAVIWISIAAGVFFMVFGNLVIHILYGKEYMEAGPVLMVVIWSRLFSLIGSTRGIWIVCEGYGKYVKYFVGCGAILNLVLNLILIPQYGVMGSAVATLVAELVSSVVVLAFFKKTRPLLKIIIDSFTLKILRKQYR